MKFIIQVIILYLKDCRNIMNKITFWSLLNTLNQETSVLIYVYKENHLISTGILHSNIMNLLVTGTVNVILITTQGYRIYTNGTNFFVKFEHLNKYEMSVKKRIPVNLSFDTKQLTFYKTRWNTPNNLNYKTIKDLGV